MADLAVLRTAKQAMEEGLLNPEDYEFIKKAFLRAQQIKAGLDAGFIKEEDYRQARDSFLHSLDFVLVASSSAGQGAVLGSAAPSVPGSPSNRGSTGNAPAAARMAPPPSLSRASASNGDLVAAANQAGAGPSGAPPQPPALPPRNSGGNGNGTVPIPTEFPERPAPVARPRLASMAAGAGGGGKTSMSGIAVDENCIKAYNAIKTRSAYKWVTYKVNEPGTEVIIDQLGAADSTYEQFTGALPPTNCRYGVYDYAYLNADTNQTINKLVFLHWAPEGTTTKNKMMYASTKDFVKSYLDGLGAELQATDPNELAETEMRERVHQAITRK